MRDCECSHAMNIHGAVAHTGSACSILACECKVFKFPGGEKMGHVSKQVETTGYLISPEPYLIKKAFIDQMIQEATGPSGEVSPRRFFDKVQFIFQTITPDETDNILREEGRYNSALNRKN